MGASWAKLCALTVPNRHGPLRHHPRPTEDAVHPKPTRPPPLPVREAVSGSCRPACYGSHSQADSVHLPNRASLNPVLLERRLGPRSFSPGHTVRVWLSTGLQLFLHPPSSVLCPQASPRLPPLPPCWTSCRWAVTGPPVAASTWSVGCAATRPPASTTGCTHVRGARYGLKGTGVCLLQKGP